MREIKFRAWDEYKKELISSEKIGTEKTGFDETGNFYIGRYDCNEDWYDDIIIMQFTGLKDKKGKEIYEGDIVCVETRYNKSIIKHKGFIKFEEATFIFACDEVADHYMTFIELFGEWDIEVIGNIYEHSELLKGE
jgi:uncharacterized phage protein (TIGR01671 family)